MHTSVSKLEEEQEDKVLEGTLMKRDRGSAVVAAAAETGRLSTSLSLK